MQTESDIWSVMAKQRVKQGIKASGKNSFCIFA